MKLAVTLPLSNALQAWFFEAWKRCESELKLTRTARHGSVPHITLSAGAVENATQIIETAALAARTLRSFTSRASGVGVFAIAQPVVHLRWPPGGRMRDTADLIHQRLDGMWWTPEPLTMPLHWVPKTTIVGGDTKPDMIPRILDVIGDGALHLDVTFDRFLMIDYGGAVERPMAEIVFRTGAISYF